MAAQVLAKEDVENYLSLVNDIVAEKKVPDAAAVYSITQMFALDNATYLGAWITVNGPKVSKKYGWDFDWRRYIYTSHDWSEEKILETLPAVFTHIAPLCERFRGYIYRPEKNGYVCQTAQTYELDKWKNGVQW